MPYTDPIQSVYDPRRKRNVYENPLPSSVMPQSPEQPDYGLSEMLQAPVHNPESLQYQDWVTKTLPLALDEQRRRQEQDDAYKRNDQPVAPFLQAAGVPADNLKGVQLPANLLPDLIKSYPQTTITPYQEAQIQLGQERNDIARSRTPANATAKPLLTPSVANSAFAQVLSEARARQKDMFGQDEVPPFNQILQQAAQDLGYDIDALNQARGIGKKGAEEVKQALTPSEKVTGPRDSDAVLNSAKQAASSTLGQGPAVGTISKGYRFKGGNPADKNSWEKVK